MVQLHTQLDCTQQISEPKPQLLPAGEYAVHVVHDELKATKRGDGEYLELRLELLDGPNKGASLWHRLNLRNPNATAVEISERHLIALGKACGIQSLSDSSQLRGIPVTAVVRIKDPKPGSEYGPTNEIVTYKKATGSPAAAPAAPSTPPWSKDEVPF